MTRFKPGSRVDKWTLLEYLGGGGSGEVWVAEAGKDTKAALKILWNKRYQGRFFDEIKLYRSLGDRAGILPLIDSLMPSDDGYRPGVPPWLAMEIGTSIVEYLGPEADFALVVQAVNRFANVLAELAEEGIYHRDIKPPNLYRLHEGFVIGDFGIADFPDKSGLTRTGEKLGPANFLAPEMIEYSGDVQSGPADVYSLAKTLWVLAAGRKFPPPGELRADNGALRLSGQVAHPRVPMLDSFIETATAHDPIRRPSMREFSDELAWWAAPVVEKKPEASLYIDEIQRIREAARVTRPETAEQRTQRLWNEAQQKVHNFREDLKRLLVSSSLQRAAGPANSTGMAKWPHGDDYGGGWSSDYWGIDTLASPWLELAAGSFERLGQTAGDNERQIGVLLALRTVSSEDDPNGMQENYYYFFESFRLGSIGLDTLIEQARAGFTAQLPEILAKFLTACKAIGVPS
jgi:serine/threonine protein kinase